MSALTKDELIKHVEKLMSGVWTDQEKKSLLTDLKYSVACPAHEVHDIILQSEGLTAEQILDKLLEG